MSSKSPVARHSASEENAQALGKRVEAVLPPKGEIRILQITDKQFGRIKVFRGKKRQKIEEPPQQITLF